MTEREKMLAGELYDCGDPELLRQWHKAKDLVRDYNNLNSADSKEKILNELLVGQIVPSMSKNIPFITNLLYLVKAYQLLHWYVFVSISISANQNPLPFKGKAQVADPLLRNPPGGELTIIILVLDLF